MIELSVVISTYNPDLNRLQQTLVGLQKQTLPLQLWQLIIVDNNSAIPVQAQIDLSWHPDHLVVSEPKQGLTYARLKGFAEAEGDIIVMVDDDNVLQDDYLQEVVNIFKQSPQLGAIGGKSVPLFEQSPPVWLVDFYGSLALRDLGEKVVIESWSNIYPDSAPIGAGMGLRKQALQAYIQKANSDKTLASDRSGESLASGGDNEIVIELLKGGWQVGYFPSLGLQHIIPAERMQKAYLARLSHNSFKSWVKLLDNQGINPWKKIALWTVPFRKVKSFFSQRAFNGASAYIKWKGYCGMLEALAEL